MKKIFIVVALSLFIYGCTNNPSADEHPTKEEWLEVYLCHRIRDWTDISSRRIAVTVTIVQKSQDIIVTLTSSNGQEEISQSAKNNWIQNAEQTVKSVLKEYNWTQNYKLTVQYI